MMARANLVPRNEQCSPGVFPSRSETGNVSTSMSPGGNDERNSAFEEGSEANTRITSGLKPQPLELDMILE